MAEIRVMTMPYELGGLRESVGCGAERALSLTSYHPACDAEGRVPPIALRLLRTVAAAL